MNYLTRTGLIPAITNSSFLSNAYQQKIPDPQANMVVVSAPFTFRPFLQDRSYVHPYSSVCSIMCNHPILDSSMKKNVNKTKEVLKRGLTTKKNIQLNYCEDDSNIGNQDDIFVPEILFRRYTQTDSRPQTPTITSPLVSKRTSTIRSRRCITPDDQHLSNAPDRTRLVLDLRKCLSHSSLAIEGKCVEMLKEGTIVYSSVIATVVSTNNADDVRNRRKKPALLSSEITKHKYFSKKTSKKETKSDLSFKKSVPYIVPAEADPQQKNKSKKQKKKKKTETKKFKKIRKKDINRELGNFSENLETEIALSAEIDIKMNHKDDDEDENNENDTKRNEYLSMTGLKFNMNIEYVETLLKAVDPDAFENDFHADKFERFLKECGLSARLRRDADFRALQEKYESEIFGENHHRRSSSIINTSHQRQEIPPSKASEFGRIISRRNARFELPLDKTELEDTHPLEYLKRYVQVSDTCRNVYNRIFHMYATTMKNQQDPSDAEPVLFITSMKDLKNALQYAMGERFRKEEQDDLCRLLNVIEENFVQIDVRMWCGICALCERIYGDRLTLKSVSAIEDSCHEIEKADFEFLDRKLAFLIISDELKEILFLIRNS